MEENEKSLHEQILKLNAKVESIEGKLETLSQKKMMIILVSGSLDRASSAMMVANLCASAGYEVSIFFTLWALNLLRVKNDFSGNTALEKMAKIMLKKGPDKSQLSQMHMMGAGTLFMKQLMKEHKFSSVSELLDIGRELGIKFYACETMMGVMGVKKEELAEGAIVLGGLSLVTAMSEASINLTF